jgi:hypothetical protein
MLGNGLKIPSIVLKYLTSNIETFRKNAINNE